MLSLMMSCKNMNTKIRNTNMASKDSNTSIDKNIVKVTPAKNDTIIALLVDAQYCDFQLKINDKIPSGFRVLFVDRIATSIVRPEGFVALTTSLRILGFLSHSISINSYL